MKLSFAPRLACCLLVAVLLAAGGCSYTTVTAWERLHETPPSIDAGLKAVMPPVEDKRTWPAVASSFQPIPDVRIFSPAITDQIRKGLVQNGLFQSLPAPDDPAAKDIKPHLTIRLTQFAINKLGTNAWVVPQLIFDGVALPAFTAGAIYSGGDMDLGGYLLPSNRYGVVLAVRVTYQEVPEGAVVERDYLVRENMNEISERRYLESVNDATTHGYALGRAEGEKALGRLVRTIAGDPVWSHLPQMREILEAEVMAKNHAPFEERVAKVQSMLPFLTKPLAMSDDEVKVLRDGFLTAESRAGVVNGMRVLWLDVPDSKSLPKDQYVSEDRAEQYFDDPKLLEYQVRAQICDRIVALAWDLISPPAAAPALAAVTPTRVTTPMGHGSVNEGVANEEPGRPAMAVKALPTAPRAATATAGPAAPGAPGAALAASPAAPAASAPSPQEQDALRGELSRELAAKLQNDVRLQAVLLQQADKAVGPAWPPMRDMLRSIKSPIVTKYLAKRGG